jgi:hypothetical protein
MSARTSPLSAFLACLRGPMVWAAHFFVLYGAETLVCMLASSPATAMRLTVLAVTAMALAILVAPLLCAGNARVDDREAQSFLRTLSIWLSTLSAGAILASAVAAWRLGACLSPTG